MDRVRIKADASKGFDGMIRSYWRPLLVTALATAQPGAASAAEPAAAPAATPPSETFRSLCAAHHARMDAVVAAARAAGFTPAAAKSSTPADITKLAVLERGAGTARQILIVATGRSNVAKELPVEVPVRTCSVTDVSGTWDLDRFTRDWTGLMPDVDAGGMILYSYLERATGNVATPSNDLPRLVAGVNAGELRALAAAQRNGARVLSWVVFEVPPTPLTVPVPPPPISLPEPREK